MLPRRSSVMIPSKLPHPPSLDELCATKNVALFLDFDGTLIEIAEGPDTIHVPDNVSQRLEALSVRLDNRLALVSGRGLDNLNQHLGMPCIARAGSHGAERLDAQGEPLGPNPKRLSSDVIDSLRHVTSVHGALFEAKPFGAAIHYRSIPENGAAIDAAVARVAEESALTIKRGKCVIELVRPGADKGSALSAFMETPAFAGSKPIFIGDDVTDEDGFVAARRLGGLGVAVGERPSDNANYKLDTVKDVHAWLNL